MEDKAKLCGKLIAEFGKHSQILCNREKGHKGPCGLIMTDKSQMPEKKILVLP